MGTGPALLIVTHATHSFPTPTHPPSRPPFLGPPLCSRCSTLWTARAQAAWNPAATAWSRSIRGESSCRRQQQLAQGLTSRSRCRRRGWQARERCFSWSPTAAAATAARRLAAQPASGGSSREGHAFMQHHAPSPRGARAHGASSPHPRPLPTSDATGSVPSPDRDLLLAEQTQLRQALPGAQQCMNDFDGMVSSRRVTAPPTDWTSSPSSLPPYCRCRRCAAAAPHRLAARAAGARPPGAC